MIVIIVMQLHYAFLTTPTTTFPTSHYQLEASTWKESMTMNTLLEKIIVLPIADDDDFLFLFSFWNSHVFVMILHLTNIQGVSAIAAFIGLVVRNEKFKTMISYPSMRNKVVTSGMIVSSPSSSSTSLRETHSLVTLIMVGCTYYCAVCMIVGNIITTITSFSSSNAEVPGILKSAIIVSDGMCMILHITIQGFLLRSAHRSNEKLRQVFAFLSLSNLSIWILEVNQISVKFDSLYNNNMLSLDILPPLFMSLNRFYSALLFLHFWRTKWKEIVALQNQNENQHRVCGILTKRKGSKRQLNQFASLPRISTTYCLVL